MGLTARRSLRVLARVAGVALSALMLGRATAIETLILPPGAAHDLQMRRLDPNRQLTLTLTRSERRWDFEDGTLQGFVAQPIAGATVGNAFTGQPTFGENVSLPRALNTSGIKLPVNPCAGLVLDEATTCAFGPGVVFEYYSALRRDFDQLRDDLMQVGGDFSAGPFPIGKQGNYWIGTYENRPSRLAPAPAGATRQARWGVTRGDAPQGRLVSPVMELGSKYFSLLVGGGCGKEVGVYLQHQVLIPKTGSVAWVTLKDAKGARIEARGVCLENMVRRTFDIGHLAGTKARILIEDRSSGSWGHINVDDILLTNRLPRASSRETDPVWGVADLHAHLMNEKAYTSFNQPGIWPEARALWGSALGPIDSLRQDNDTHTTLGDNYVSFVDYVHGSTYTLCRDICLNLLEGAGLPEVEGDQVNQGGLLGGFHSVDGGFPNFRDWPMWYSATHQQMHWSWVRRAYQGGLRLMIASVGNSEVVSFAMSKEKDRPFSSDQDALALQIPAIEEFARQNEGWARVVRTPQEARRVINSGKLAIVIGVELDHVMDSCDADVRRVRHHTASDYMHPDLWLAQGGLDLDVATGIVGGAQFLGLLTEVVHYGGHPPTCSAAQIEARVEALHREGVRQIVPMHFSDNLLGGYAITDGLFVASAVFGHPHAMPPRLQSADELVANYGPSAAAFQPVAREGYYRENEDRRREWEARLPVANKLEDMSVPIWVRLAPDQILNPSIVPPGIGRNILEVFTGRCVSDDGWRAVLAIFSGGLTEAACAASTFTADAIEAARSSLPWEGATDSPAMIPVSPSGAMKELPFHVNSRGLTPEGETFVSQMMRRGMLVDVQHSSDLAKKSIFRVAGPYPTMASHGGVAQELFRRANENTLSQEQLRSVYAPPAGFTPGLIGMGVQSTRAFVGQLREVAGSEDRGAANVELRAVALGTDFNGMDWHAPPRFGKYALYGKTPAERRHAMRDRDVGARVAYAPYPVGTNPWAPTTPICDPACPEWNNQPVSSLRPIVAQQIVSGGRTTRTFDINFDGLAHYGLIPDFLQELRVLGASLEEMGTLFRSSEALIRMWEEGCFLAYHMETPPPASIAAGCGSRSDYD